jgi:hypothetical protein
MANTNTLRWLPTAEAARRAALAIAGLGLITGMATTPLAATTADEPNTAPTLGATAIAPAATPTTKPAAPAKPGANVQAPSANELMPRPVTAPQQAFTPTAEQMRNAEAIVKTGQDLKLPPRAQVIAVATALQESTLHNYGDLGALNDHDSQGLFQQRPSAGWGSPEQITNPDYAATKFYKKLVEVKGWDKMPLTQAAQTVQVSAFPDHYAKWENMAADLVRATHGDGPYAEIAKDGDKGGKTEKVYKNDKGKNDKGKVDQPKNDKGKKDDKRDK